MTDISSQLKRELRRVGASPAEIEALLPLAASLSKLRHQKESIISLGPTAHFSTKMAVWSAGVCAGLLLVTLVIVASRPALPGTWLYPVQKISDNFVAALYPEDRASIMMKRASQVNQLVATHADSRVIMSTLRDYSDVASAYEKAPHVNYADYSYCKSKLQQAAIGASPSVRHVISVTLKSLDTT